MTQVLVTVVATAPVLVEASVRAEQVTQLVLGELADVQVSRDDWFFIHTRFDAYPGWIHQGYVRLLTSEAAKIWEREAAWSDGAQVESGSSRMTVPLRARVRLMGDEVILPDGRAGTVTAGVVAPMPIAVATSRDVSVVAWIQTRFTGTPYLWGGVTPAGVDCSGLVQTAFAARGVPLPRDARQQALCGECVSLTDRREGDLLFFHGEESEAITHVAILGPGGALCHSALGRGGVVVEPSAPGTPGGNLMRRLVAARRLPLAIP